MQIQEEEEEETSFCPSFSSYSCDKLANIAVKVCQENNNVVEVEDDQFEFVSFNTNPDAGFPVFNRDLLLLDNNNNNNDMAASIQFPLKNLFEEENHDNHPSSSSSSESDELERIQPGTYCVWTPKSPNCCKKSKSTGSSSSGSKRWSFRDLLKRSHSDGKESFIYLNSSNPRKEEKIEKIEKISNDSSKVKVKAVAKMSAHEEFYVRNKVLKEGDKRRSYLPYRQDLVGFFSNNMNGLGKTFPF